jgi:hypothetical protein
MGRPQTGQITSCHVINACRAFGLVNCGDAEKGSHRNLVGREPSRDEG